MRAQLLLTNFSHKSRTLKSGKRKNNNINNSKVAPMVSYQNR